MLEYEKGNIHMKLVYTKKDFLDILSRLGIQEGMTVLVQADLPGFGKVVGSEQAFIDALKELVKEDGCIIVPTFTLSCLDPACFENSDFEYESWGMIRDNSLGYDSNLTPCDVYSSLGEQFLKNEGVVRTSHPIYSFAFWGNYEAKCLDQPLHFPISFGRILRAFVNQNAMNLLINVDPKESLLLPALAKMMNQGIITIKKAMVKKNSRIQLKNFLNLELEQETIEEYLKMFFIQSREYQGKWVYALSLDTNNESI